MGSFSSPRYSKWWRGDIEMDVKEVDTPIEELIDQSNEFTKEMGLETKSGDKK